MLAIHTGVISTDRLAEQHSTESLQVFLYDKAFASICQCHRWPYCTHLVKDAPPLCLQHSRRCTYRCAHTIWPPISPTQSENQWKNLYHISCQRHPDGWKKCIMPESSSTSQHMLVIIFPCQDVNSHSCIFDVSSNYDWIRPLVLGMIPRGYCLPYRMSWNRKTDMNYSIEVQIFTSSGEPINTNSQELWQELCTISWLTISPYWTIMPKSTEKRYGEKVVILNLFLW